MDVTARPVTASGSRVYDGTTTVNGTNLTSISNLAGTDTLSITGQEQQRQMSVMVSQ